MRTILPFSVLILALCVGCPQTAEPGKGNNIPTSDTMTDTDKPEPLVIPLEPQDDSPEGIMEEENAAPEMTAVVAESLKKYAAEAVPLPPVDDLTTQVDEYVTKLGSSLENLDGSPKYTTDAADVVRDANALSLVAMAIGLAEADSKYKKSAPQIIVAAKNLAAAESFDEGQKAYDGLKSALTSTGGEIPLSWADKTAELIPLMKAVPNLSSTVKRLTNTERKLTTQLERKPQSVYGPLAALAVISQGSIANASETSKPDAVAEWKKFCEEFRDTALKANAIAHQFAEKKADYAAFKAAIDTMSESCEHCHEVFCPSAVGKGE